MSVGSYQWATEASHQNISGTDIIVDTIVSYESYIPLFKCLCRFFQSSVVTSEMFINLDNQVLSIVLML